jgi:Flp pilus assembly protein TadG
MPKLNDQEVANQGRGDHMPAIPAIPATVASHPGMACLAKQPDRRALGGARAMNGRTGKPGSSPARRWLSRLPARLPGRLLQRRHGTAAVELALIAPMLLTLFAGIIDFARVFDQEIALSTAVASAAQYALLNVASINSTSAASLAATLSGIVANSNGAAWAGATVSVNGGSTSTVASGSTTSGGTAANANSCWCPTGASSAAWAFGTAATCGSACTGGTLAGKFVTITGTRAFSAIFGNFGLISNRTLHQSAIVQAQ